MSQGLSAAAGTTAAGAFVAILRSAACAEPAIKAAAANAVAKTVFIASPFNPRFASFEPRRSRTKNRTPLEDRATLTHNLTHAEGLNRKTIPAATAANLGVCGFFRAKVFGSCNSVTGAGEAPVTAGEKSGAAREK